MYRRVYTAIAALVFVTTALDAQNPEQTYFEFQVTKPVRQAPSSKAPLYPPELKMAGTQGEVLAQFVVDTLGEPLVTSFRVLRSSHGLFTEAIRTALPEMRFVPAEMNGRKVRQLVQQPFVFAIAGKEGAAPSATAAQPQAPAEIPPVFPRLPLPLTPAPRAGTVDGWWLEQMTTFDSGNGAPASSVTTRTYGAAGRVRTETRGARIAPLGEMIMLLDSVAGRVSLLVPSRKMVTVSPLGNQPEAIMRAEPVAASRTVTDLGDGEAIMGVTTRRYRISGMSGTRVTFGDRTCTIERPTDMDVWTTTDPVLVEVQQRMSRTSRSMLGAFLSGQAILQQEETPPGARLRYVSRTAIVGKDGGTATMTMTFEVTDFAKGPIEAALFDPPEGYQLLDGSMFRSSARTDSLARSAGERLFARFVDSTNAAPGEKRSCASVAKP